LNKFVSFSHGTVALSFDDVVLVPSRSDVVPADAQVSTKLTKKIGLNIPIVSSAMDTVTEEALAIALALQGGMGVIHRNNTPLEQAEMVLGVKRYADWVVRNPASVSPSTTIGEVRALSSEIGAFGFPVVDGGKLVGIITARDVRFAESDLTKVGELMTREVVTLSEGAHTLGEARKLMHEHRIEKLPLVDSKGVPVGMITHKDVMRAGSLGGACLDSKGRLVVGAAIGVRDDERVQLLLDAGVDCLVVDTAHGHSQAVLDAVKRVKKEFPSSQVIAGNVSTREGTEELIAAGADAVKVGQGPGSICTTRVVSGAGMPQLSAVLECADAAKSNNIPVIADGGIRFSGDVAKAIAAGASAVMLGSLLAGTDESPGRTVFVGGRKFKQYRGMGSVGAMMKSQGGKSRYHQEHVQSKSKLVPEGIEGLVPWKGTVSEVVFQLVGGLKSGMGYCGCRTIEELRVKARFAQISAAGNTESHPHGIMITDEAPNYQQTK